MKYMPKKDKICVFLILLSIFNVYSLENNYYPLNKIISFLKLDTEYNSVTGSLLIKKNKKNVLITLNSSYLIFNNKKYFINDFVRSEQGQFFVPTKEALFIMKYFSPDKYEYYTKDGDIFFQEKKEDKNDKNIEEIYIDKENDNDSKKENLNNTKKLEINKDIKEKKVKIEAIIIDAGHGGKDPGAIGYDDIKEKDIVLRTAHLITEKLKEFYPDKKIIMTRSKDVFIELEDRASIANKIFQKYGTSIFISIHVNASRSQKTYGFETWYLVSNYSRKIIKKGEVSKDKDVENIVNSMLNDEIYKESKDFAKKIQNGLEKKIGNVSKNRGIKEEVYFVIKKAIMPAVLVEIGFNTNKYEAIRLTKYSYLNNISEGIFSGIRNFIDDYEKTQGFRK
ncbi:MAG: hypothetical protein A2086_06700 [Spirochaetes bacterium GWD1_27_9]|nr:MAG: hypothetical protein A2086_06700 [Spirochaetes bacterium GWD1_27_9]